MSTNMTFLTDVAMITCVVQTGNADVIIKAARDAGATAALVHHGRGIGIRERLGILGVAVDADLGIWGEAFNWGSNSGAARLAIWVGTVNLGGWRGCE